MILTGCVRQDLRLIRLPVTETEHSGGATAVWREYRQFALGMAHGDIYDQYQLTSVISFFEGLTGIEAGQEISGLGYTLDRKRLEEAIGKWDVWFKDNGGRVVWNQARKRYELTPR